VVGADGIVAKDEAGESVAEGGEIRVIELERSGRSIETDGIAYARGKNRQEPSPGDRSRAAGEFDVVAFERGVSGAKISRSEGDWIAGLVRKGDGPAGDCVPGDRDARAGGIV